MLYRLLITCKKKKPKKNTHNSNKSIHYMEINCGYKNVYCKLKQILLGFTELRDAINVIILHVHTVLMNCTK